MKISVQNAGALALGLLLAAGGRTDALADDAVTAAPEQYKVEFENERVRVLRGTYAPGAKAAMHEHPAAVVIQLTGGNLMMRMPDGESGEGETQAGAAGWSEPVMHEVTNTGDEPFEVVIVELKD